MAGCVADIRIPLMWKDTDHFKNKGGELMACFVFVDSFLFHTGSPESEVCYILWKETSLYSLEGKKKTERKKRKN